MNSDGDVSDVDKAGCGVAFDTGWRDALRAIAGADQLGAPTDAPVFLVLDAGVLDHDAAAGRAYLAGVLAASGSGRVTVRQARS